MGIIFTKCGQDEAATMNARIMTRRELEQSYYEATVKRDRGYELWDMEVKLFEKEIASRREIKR